MAEPAAAEGGELRLAEPAAQREQLIILERSASLAGRQRDAGEHAGAAREGCRGQGQGAGECGGLEAQGEGYLKLRRADARAPGTATDRLTRAATSAKRQPRACCGLRLHFALDARRETGAWNDAAVRESVESESEGAVRHVKVKSVRAHVEQAAIVAVTGEGEIDIWFEFEFVFFIQFECRHGSDAAWFFDGRRQPTAQEERLASAWWRTVRLAQPQPSTDCTVEIFVEGEGDEQIEARCSSEEVREALGEDHRQKKSCTRAAAVESHRAGRRVTDGVRGFRLRPGEVRHSPESRRYRGAA